MKVILPVLLVTLLAITPVSVATAQTAKKTEPDEQTRTATNGRRAEPSADTAEEPSILIHLVGGGRLEVEELRETSDGIWYKRGGLTTLLDPKSVVRIERPSQAQNKLAPASERAASWKISDATKVETFFLTTFGRPLPISALGQSDIHNRWGLDHRQGLDIGVHPDSREGLALAEFLKSEQIPFMVFRGPIPGVATGPHIHVGFPSHRYLTK